jgi:hypothetical protein
MRRITPNLVVVLMAGAGASLLVAMFALAWSELPDPMAVHWGLDGAPDGSAPRLLAALSLVGLLAAVAIGVFSAVRRSRREAPSFTAGLFAAAGLLVTLGWFMIAANRGVEVWSSASNLGWLQILLPVVVAAGLGSVGWFVAGGKTAADPLRAVPAPALNVKDPEHTVWSGRGLGKATTAIGIVMVVVAVVTWGWPSVGLFVIAALLFMFAYVRVTVSWNGVVVSLGWWGYPSWRVPIDSIDHAEVEKVNPMAYGGWGYRLRPGVRAVVVRAGDAVRLVRNEGYDLVYTVDDAVTGAGLVNSIVGVEAE